MHDAVFYAVANMPGAVPVTSTSLTNATLPYVTRIADLGWRAALASDTTLARGRMSAFDGVLTSGPVAEAWGHDHTSIEEVLAS